MHGSSNPEANVVGDTTTDAEGDEIRTFGRWGQPAVTFLVARWLQQLMKSVQLCATGTTRWANAYAVAVSRTCWRARATGSCCDAWREGDTSWHGGPSAKSVGQSRRARDCGRPPGAQLFDASDGYPTTAPVGSFPAGATPEGVLDLAGNVWEWTDDWYTSYDAASVSDPSPARGEGQPKKVIRGGGWAVFVRSILRGAFRNSNPPEVRTHDIGFRCVYLPGEGR